MKSAEPADARISIIGAGPGGLTCARILQQRASRSPSMTATRAATPATKAAPSTCTLTTPRSPCAKPACSTSSSPSPAPKGRNCARWTRPARSRSAKFRRPTNS